jgi:circadian clock protein KaiB
VSPYALTLFVSGASDLSARAILDATRLCGADPVSGYDLTVVDLHDDPALGLANRVVAAPTLIRSRPLPVRKVVGDLSDMTRVRLALDLPSGGAHS